jgi:hypothetical protein
MMITNWYGVFTVLLASHSIAVMIAWIVGKESQDKNVTQRDFMSREWIMRNHPSNGGE